MTKKDNTIIKEEIRAHVFPSKRGFPTFATILLILGVIWLLNDLALIAIDIPWVPVILIVISLGMFFNKYHRK